MADSDSLRARRYRAHWQGDHHLCRHLASVPAVAVSMQHASTASGGDLDPVAELRQLAADALADYRADRGNAQLLREARMTLLAIPPGADIADPLDELRAIVGDVP